MNKNLHSTKKVATFATLLESTDSLAQLVEHNTFNVGVLGSSPRRITNKTSQIANQQQFGLFLFSKSSANCLQNQKLRQHSVNAGAWQRTIVGYDSLPPRRFLSASKASRKWISTGDSWYWVRSRNLSYSSLALSLATSAETLPA